MASVYRETYTKPLRPGAELFTRKGERFARWTDRRGRKRTAKVTAGRDGSLRIVLECSTFTAKYRDGAGLVKKVGTGCRQRDTAETVLTDLRNRAERVKANVLTPAQDAVADHQAVPLGSHIHAYITYLTAKGVTPGRVKTARQRLQAVAEACQFRRLADLNGAAFERWLADRQAEGMSAGCRNAYREACVGFANWCKRNARLLDNPFVSVPKADAKADCRRKRRALTEDEMLRLLAVAQLRPLADFGRPKEKIERRLDDVPKRTAWTRAPLTFDTVAAAAERGREVLAKHPEYIAELEQRGRERGLIYKTLLLTGLRKAELASLTVGQLDLDGPTAFAVLNAADEKNRQGNTIPLRADLAADLRAWLADRLTALQDAARKRIGQAVPMRLPPETPLFNVPAGLVRILDRDLRAAGIPKRDDRGRTVDVHALRHTFGTHLSKRGVPLRIAQEAMRHSDPKLTANVYTDPRLLDVAGALDVLPALPLDGRPAQAEVKATGTADAARTLGPTLGPTSDFSSTSVAKAGKTDAAGQSVSGTGRDNVSACGVNDKRTLSFSDSVRQLLGAKGFEPSTSASRTQRSKPG
jgi:integrase